MSHINSGKVVAGGILAGIVLAGFDFVSSNFLLANEWQDVAHLRNIDPALMGGTTALVTMLLVDFVLGQALVLTYAAIRPRFGAGPGTGAIASFFVFLPQALLLATLGGWFLPWDLYFRQATVMLVSLLAAGFAGGWVYAEVEEDAA
jgi:hypothetical protein